MVFHDVEVGKIEEFESAGVPITKTLKNLINLPITSIDFSKPKIVGFVKAAKVYKDSIICEVWVKDSYFKDGMSLNKVVYLCDEKDNLTPFEIIVV